MSKTIDGVIGFVSGTTAASNYIKQISDGSVTHDVAVQNGITFFSGANDPNGIEWDGRQPLEVVIPSVSDIVSSPIVFAGTVDSNGTISYASGFGPDPAKGYLVYITDDCTFASEVCEGGDMAVYDGTDWRIIQGENQVALVGTADNSGNIDVLLSGTVAEVLNVEGKALRLGLDYTDVRNNISYYKNNATNLSVQNGIVNVSPMYIKLSKENDSTVDITTAESIDLPTALADGTVTINENVLEASNFTFNSGSFPTISKNSASITVNATHNMAIAKGDSTGDFVTNVTAIKGVSFAAGTSASNDIAYMTGLSAISGTSFVSGIHAYTVADEGKTPDLVIPGAVSIVAENNTFISGLSADDAASGDVVSSVSVGSVTIGAGSGILTGTTSGSTAFVKSVTMGSAIKDTTASWFVDGLGTAGTSGDVVTDVTVGTVSLVSSNGGSPAIVSASVSNHVLSFTTGNFQTPVEISQANSTISKASFTKAGVSLSGFDSVADTFTTGAISQANTTVSYKSLLSKAVTLSQDTASQYFFDKSEDHAYEAVMGYKSINVVDADIVKNNAVISNPTITATIPANTVAVDLNAGTLPSLSIDAASGSLTASVSTTLSTSTYSWLGVDESKKNVTVAGAYSIVTGASTDTGVVEVAAAASNYALENGQVTVASDSFITDIIVAGSPIGPGAPNA